MCLCVCLCVRVSCSSYLRSLRRDGAVVCYIASFCGGEGATNCTQKHDLIYMIIWRIGEMRFRRVSRLGLDRPKDRLPTPKRSSLCLFVCDFVWVATKYIVGVATWCVNIFYEFYFFIKYHHKRFMISKLRWCVF